MTDQDPQMPVWAIRLEGKVDVALERHGGRLDRHSEILDDHEDRVRAIESAKGKSVTWPALALALSTIFACSGGLAAYINYVAN